jgi:hypothetical protein
MRFIKYINEDNVENIIKVFSNIPNNVNDITNYIVDIFDAVGVKQEPIQYSAYLSGPMTNLPDMNWPTFICAEKYIDGEIFNPAKPHGSIIKKPKGTFTWYDFMTEDVSGLLKCKDVIVLPGWSKSTGAIIEVKIGENILKTKAKPIKSVVGSKYLAYVGDVKNRYYQDGNIEGYDKVIEPMLLAKSENDAARMVKSFIPENSIVNEGIVNDIKNFLMSAKHISMLSILGLIGNIFDKSNVSKIKR